MKKIIFILVFLMSQSLLASGFSFDVFSNDEGSNSIEITSESSISYLYLVTRKDGRTAPDDCDHGTLVLNFRDSITSIVKVDPSASATEKYAYRFCVYAKTGSGQRLEYTETFLK